MTKKHLQHLQHLQKRRLRSRIKTEARSRLGFGLFLLFRTWGVIDMRNHEVTEEQPLLGQHGRIARAGLGETAGVAV